MQETEPVTSAATSAMSLHSAIMVSGNHIEQLNVYLVYTARLSLFQVLRIVRVITFILFTQDNCQHSLCTLFTVHAWHMLTFIFFIERVLTSTLFIGQVLTFSLYIKQGLTCTPHTGQALQFYLYAPNLCEDVALQYFA